MAYESDESDFEDAIQFPHDDHSPPPPAPQQIIERNPTDDHPVGIVIGEIQAEINANPVEDDVEVENLQNLQNDEIDRVPPIIVEDNNANGNNNPQGGINAHDIVRQVIDNLWPALGVPGGPIGFNDDFAEEEDGMDNVEDGYFDEEENGNDESDDANSPAGQDNDDAVPPPDFDLQLPSRHQYLGEEMEELHGRVLFMEEGTSSEIPLIVMGLQLVPGQTLPLTIFHAVFQNAIRRCVLNDRVFGIVHNDMDTSSGSMVYKGAFGTLAEIYEFQEENDHIQNGSPGGMTTFALKAKGRQRFNVLNFRRQADGNLMGTVKIRPEIRLPPFVQGAMLGETHRYRFPLKRRHLEEDKENTSSEEQQQSQSPASKFARTLRLSCSSGSGSSGDHDGEDKDEDMALVDQELKEMKEKILEQRKISKYYSAFTPFPYFVYEQFDELVLVEKVHRKLRIELKGLTESGSIIPKDASELSFWLAQNLTMDDHYRIKILKMDSPVQRLRYELELLSKACKVITCKHCQTTIADNSDIFSMSIEGPQGTYVNPSGFVHETLTVYKSKDVTLRGFPSTEASWFPGYAWTIAECRRCSTHLGWKFKAVGRMKPPKFFGLARRSISFKYNFNAGDDNEGVNSAIPLVPIISTELST